jgi:RND superfamily putative drug exporter|tara:strand:- start:1818 stop:4184 length:2367 start_codon:yes stop_codon:yes gene_type:complete
MSLQSIVYFCARKPLIVIGVWILVVIGAGLISQNFLDTALNGGQGPTKDLEFNFAENLKKNKLSLLNKSNPDFQQKTNDQTSDNLLIISSENYIFPSEEFFSSANGFFQKVQEEIDNSGINENVGLLNDYQVNPSADGSTVMISAPFVKGDLVSPLIHLTEDYSDLDFKYYFIGTASIEYTFQELAEKDLVTGEAIGISVALIILALVFGSVTSAFIPVILAVVSIFVGIGIVAIIGQFISLNDFVPNIMSMMGLAVGIDYCLFILSRYREERVKGLEKIDAIVSSGSSAGRAVMFSGMTVVLALVGLFIIPEKTFQAFGVGAIVVVFVAVLAGITLLPSILGILGDRVNSFYVPKGITIILYLAGFLFVAFTQDLGPILLIVSFAVLFILVIVSLLRQKGISLKILSPDNESNQDEGGFWNTVTIQVMKWPYISMTLAGCFLLFLSYFYLDLEKGSGGISALPDGEPVKIGFTLLDEKFGFGSDAPANIVIDGNIESPNISTAIKNLESLLIEDEGFNAPEIIIEPSVNYAELTSRIPGDPFDQAALNSIEKLRENLIPLAFEGILESEYKIFVGGQTAEVVDQVKMTDEYFPYVIGIVLALSLILLLFAFRSITIAIASIIMNLLSVGAAYGLLVLVFQKGFMINILGFEQVDQIEFWLPIFMFSILFGLSMDYHVFMLSRIKENFDDTKSSDNSVAFGLRKTASIITGAALIMVAVFGGFSLGEISFFQSMGFGLGSAVLIDATIVRSILVPSVMKILGTRAWYLPKWLNWLPNISIEGSSKTSK